MDNLSTGPPPPRRLHNPNHPPLPSARDTYNPSASPTYGPPPSSQQPPAQQPSYDPFPRRDPFMPASSAASTQSDRREPNSFWSSSSNSRPQDIPSMRALHPQPPPPLSPFQRPGPRNGEESTRRSSLTGSANGDPTNSFMSRNMPPPVPSPQHSPDMPPPASHARQPYTNGASRDGSSMSISSIMAPESTSARPSSRAQDPLQPYSKDKNNGRPSTPERQNGQSLHSPGMHASPLQHSMSHLLKPFHASQSVSAAPQRPYSQPAADHINDQDRFIPRNGRDDYHYVPRRTASEDQRNPDRRDRSLSDLGARAPPPTAMQPLNSVPPGALPPPSSAYQPSWQPEPQVAAAYAADHFQLPPRPYGPLAYGPPAPLPPQSIINSATYPEPVYGPHYDRKMDDDFRDRHVLVDDKLRRSIEESQASHRALVGLGQDARRLDRSSPLPQAVQGASAQPAGSGRDPTIKSEFGRMFSGLGSGVGSTPQPMTHPHGLPSHSPHQDEDDEYDGRLSALGRSRPGRPLASARKRTYDITYSSEDGEGRSSPVGLMGSKKPRQSYTTTPHHHHHHHHHHYRRPEDEIPARRASGTPVSYRSTVPPHHHHHPQAPHHHHHHHHHTPRPQAAFQLQPMRIPSTTIKTKPLLQSLADRPRKHLGSQLYAPKIARPATSVPSDSKYLYATEPNPVPVFEGHENCTFTIRVPRSFLTHDGREHVCLQRRVWGTDVYTDDSDPLAAAIHSGWIRGAWNEDVDEELILGPSASKDIQGDEKGQSTAALLEPPKDGPVEPPADRDAHITILLLPALEKYAATTWHGVRSRKWGDNHDGMSFKIEKIEWVDEALSLRFEESGGRANKARIARQRKLIPKKARERLNGVIGGREGLGGMRSVIIRA